MISYFDTYFRNNEKTLNFLYAIVFMALVGAADYLSGPEIVLTVFYVLPVIFIEWYTNLRLAYAAALISVVIMLLTDHLIRDFSHWLIQGWNFISRLGFVIIVVTLVEMIKRMLHDEYGLARMDSLTGLMNGLGFHEIAKLELDRMARLGRPITLAYCDLDNFKQVNDTYGHDQGDNLLREVARVLRSNSRKIDSAARLGGDEFVLLLSETGAETAKIVMRKIQDKLLELMQQKERPVTVSIGVLTFEVPPVSVSAMVKMTDKLMYRVKNSGKNNITFQSYRPTVTEV